MISLELAKKLKDAGLKWEPRGGDAYYDPNSKNGPFLFCHHLTLNRKLTMKGFIFAPSLSQLLAEIEGRGWVYGLHSGPFKDGKYQVDISQKDGKYINLDVGGKFAGNEPEEAAGNALLLILEREKDE